MDLGIASKRAIVCASSRGLGRACAEALAAEGVHVVVNGRNTADLVRAAAELRDRYGVDVHAVAGDIAEPEVQRELRDACPAPDILVTNNAGPAPAPFATLDREAWIRALDANMVAPVTLIQSVIQGMCRRRFGRIVNVTSAMVTTPRPTMGLSSGARAGMTAVMKGLSLEVARDNVTINNLLPERFDTDRQLFMAQRAVEQEGVDMIEARRRQIESIAARRLGEPEEFGATCAFLCSTYAGYLSGQNIHLDGGSYPGLI